jgi:hypothetical protein
VFVRVSDYVGHARQGRYFLGRPLRIASGNNDFARRIMSLDAPDHGPGVLFGGGGNRTGIEYYPFGGG